MTMVNVKRTSLDLLRAVPEDEAARQLQRQTGGRWLAWFGHATGDFWATRTAPYPWNGLMCRSTPEALHAAMAELDALHGFHPDGSWR